jgi:SPP1 gp7 family putative phage head morphogenesis protein
MPKSQVVITAESQKRKLLAREAAKMREMARRWLEVERALEAEMVKIAAELAAETLVTEAMILNHARFERLLYQARAEFSKYADYVEETVMRLQLDTLTLGADDAFRTLQVGLKEAGLSTTFNRLNVDAINMLFGFSADGSPLRGLLMKSYGEAVNGIIRELVLGLAKGLNPVKVARSMADAFSVGLDRALTIARTEQLRAYRMGAQEQYRESRIVLQYMRLADKSPETCAGCLFMDGEIYDTIEEFEEHPNGRCTLVPVIDGAAVPEWETGMQWFEKQSQETQIGILGQGRFDAWQNGTPLSEMSKHVEDPTWGGSFVPTPVKELDQ